MSLESFFLLCHVHFLTHKRTFSSQSQRLSTYVRCLEGQEQYTKSQSCSVLTGLAKVAGWKYRAITHYSCVFVVLFLHALIYKDCHYGMEMRNNQETCDNRHCNSYTENIIEPERINPNVKTRVTKNKYFLLERNKTASWQVPSL